MESSQELSLEFEQKAYLLISVFITVSWCWVSTFHYISKELFISVMPFHGNINPFNSDKWYSPEPNILLK